MTVKASQIRGRMDRFGILLSSLCALHCVIGIVLIAGFGLGGGLLLHPSLHRYGLAIAILVAAVAIGLGVMRHRRAAPLIVATIGLGLMAGGLLVEHGIQEAVLTISGVSFVAAGHLLNLRKA